MIRSKPLTEWDALAPNFGAHAAAAGTNFDPEKAIGPFLDLSEVPELLIVDSEGVARPA